jgi:deazaflavin-dependent oxidoreductase (nitroreductase family)
MAKQFQRRRGQQVGNAFIATLVRLGVGPKSTYLLTVNGRKTGKPRTTPVMLVETGEGRWLVAPYGAVSWVRNARAAGRVTLRRGGRSEEATVVELDPPAAAPVLQKYLAAVPLVRPYFDVTPESPVDAFVAEAPRHPVFALTRPASG